MSFSFDHQTTSDLELFPAPKRKKTILSYYNCLKTKGGQRLLQKIFNAPVSDIDFLENRTNEIRFFYDNDCRLNLNSRSVDFIEYYLTLRRIPLKANIIDATVDALSNRLNPDNDYFVIREGILYIAQLLKDFESFIRKVKDRNIPGTVSKHLDEVSVFLAAKPVIKLLDEYPENPKDLSFNLINRYDNYFRLSSNDAFINLITIVYEIDFLQSMGDLMKENGLCLPGYSKEKDLIFKATDAFHPLLEQPVKNCFEFRNGENLCFLTGPNMSGKSTFLKTMGLLVYLSHLGLPVPATSFRTSVFDGLYTTINLSDDINLGYSHFYAEVSRVKDLALKLNSDNRLVIIFDELFRGTNVKDAFDASLGIISSLSKISDNLFFISTHILEVAENIEKSDTIIFRCFESELVNDEAVYDFKLKEGISMERVGMRILHRENVLQILEEKIRKQI